MADGPVCCICGRRYRRHQRDGMMECASCARQPADAYWEQARPTRAITQPLAPASALASDESTPRGGA